MMKKRLLLAAAWLLTTACLAQQVKVEFMTPSIVHVVKGEATPSLVVIAKPEQVDVVQKGKTWSSSVLTVKQDAQGNLTFQTAKGTSSLASRGSSHLRRRLITAMRRILS